MLSILAYCVIQFFPKELELGPYRYDTNLAFRRRFGHNKSIHTVEGNRIIEMHILSPFFLPRGILH